MNRLTGSSRHGHLVQQVMLLPSHICIFVAKNLSRRSQELLLVGISNAWLLRYAFHQGFLVNTGRKNRFALNFATQCKVAIAVNILANLETKLWTKIPTNSLVQMKGNLSQIYPIPFPSQKKELYLQISG